MLSGAKAAGRRIAQRVRHLPWIEHADWMWDRLRGPYAAALGLGGTGVPVRVGGVLDVPIPPEFAAADWETYEPETVAALVRWIQRHQRGTVIDVGCSLGVFSACALAASPETRVIAADSDLASLKATHRMASFVGASRLRLLYGLITDRHGSGFDFLAAERYTKERLAESGVSGEPGTTRYVCLEDGAEDIPRSSLDGLLMDLPAHPGPQLLKMDIEGAELLALAGARQWLSRDCPELLLSVHPEVLAMRRQSSEQLRAFLGELNYDIQVLAVDHEEHWWCESRHVRTQALPA